MLIALVISEVEVGAGAGPGEILEALWGGVGICPRPPWFMRDAASLKGFRLAGRVVFAFPFASPFPFPFPISIFPWMSFPDATSADPSISNPASNSASSLLAEP